MFDIKDSQEVVRDKVTLLRSVKQDIWTIKYMNCKANVFNGHLTKYLHKKNLIQSKLRHDMEQTDKFKCRECYWEGTENELAKSPTDPKEHVCPRCQSSDIVKVEQ